MSKDNEGGNVSQSSATAKKSWWEKVTAWADKNPWKKFAALVVAIWVVGYNAIVFIQTKAQEAVLNEKFLANLATRVRPTCVFNSRGSVEAAAGFEDYVADINVAPLPVKFGFQITVKAKKHLHYEPLVTCLDGNLHLSKSERGRLHDWVYEVVPNPKGEMFFTKDDRMDTNAVFRFKLEILH